MQTSITRIHDPAKAKAYFEDKLAFTTGPVELDRWIKTGEDNLVSLGQCSRGRELYFRDHQRLVDDALSFFDAF